MSTLSLSLSSSFCSKGVKVSSRYTNVGGLITRTKTRQNRFATSIVLLRNNWSGWIRLSVRVRPLVECKQEWRRGKRGGRYERLVRSDQGRDGKDDEVDYVFQKDARRGDTRRRHTGGGRGDIIQRLGSRFSIGSLYLAKLLANYELRRARRMSHGCVARPVSPSLSLSFRRNRPRERRREKKETKEKEEVSPREIGYAATGKWEERLKNLPYSIRCPSSFLPIPLCDRK